MSTDSIGAEQLLAFIERVERLEEDRKTVSDEIKDVYAEAKGAGYDVKIVRKIVSIRKQDQDKRREEEEILELYMQALGMLADTPLGSAAVKREFGTIGKPVPLTDLEKEMGVEAAFVNRKGIRSSISIKPGA